MSKPIIEERLYIGNIDYSVTEDDLRAYYEGLLVEQVELPTKTLFKHLKTKKPIIRTLGFGFVQFASKDEADKALEKTDGKEIKGRTVFAKKAHPPPTEEERKERAEDWKKFKQERKARREGVKPAADAEKKAEKPAEAAPSNGPRKKKQDTNKTPLGVTSEDTVFVTNLDFKATSELLHETFEPLNPKWVHVPPKRVPRYLLKQIKQNHKPLYNRGIAFVKFSDHESQQRAIAEFNGSEVNGRQIIVEAAVNKPESEEPEEAEKAEKAEEAEETATGNEAVEEAAALEEAA